MSRKRQRVWDAADFRAGFTLIELLVVIAIIALLVSILLPSLTQAKELARRVTCMSNLKGVGIGLLLYAEDNEMQIPPPNATVLNTVRAGGRTVEPVYRGEYLKDLSLVYCPSDDNHTVDHDGLCKASIYMTYLYVRPIGADIQKNVTVVLHEYPPSWFDWWPPVNAKGGWTYYPPHKDVFNALATDGTVGKIDDSAECPALGPWDYNEMDSLLGVTGKL